LAPLKFVGRLAAWLIEASRAVAATQSSLDDLTAATIRRLGLQTTLPRSDVEPGHGFSLQLPEATLWVVVVVAVAALLYALKDLRWARPGLADDPRAALTGSDTDARYHLARAEQFAQQGLFVQAMHELLLEGFGEIRARAGAGVADSLTSREILRGAPLPEEGLGCLRDMFAKVEWTYFGNHPAGRDDYLACRARFDALRAVLHRP
jgi:hypothetical protein